MQSDGVTSVILFATQAMINALMIAATANNFKPEWIMTGYQFSDFDGYARNWDQDAGVTCVRCGRAESARRPAPRPPPARSTGTGVPSREPSAPRACELVRLHLRRHPVRGPEAHGRELQEGLLLGTRSGGASDGTVTFQTGYGRTVGLPYDEYFGLGTDIGDDLVQPEHHGGANAVASAVGKGKWMYLNEGKRFSFGSFPKDAKFFDTATAVAEVPTSQTYVDGVAPAPNPCTGCPSTSSQ